MGEAESGMRLQIASGRSHAEGVHASSPGLAMRSEWRWLPGRCVLSFEPLARNGGPEATATSVDLSFLPVRCSAASNQLTRITRVTRVPGCT